MKIKIMLLAIIFFTTNAMAHAMPISNSEQTYYLKVRNNTKNSVDKQAATMIFLNGSSAGDKCLNENNYGACERFNNSVSQLISICHKYNYKRACDNATHLVDHHTARKVFQ